MWCPGHYTWGLGSSGSTEEPNVKCVPESEQEVLVSVLNGMSGKSLLEFVTLNFLGELKGVPRSSRPAPPDPGNAVN